MNRTTKKSPDGLYVARAELVLARPDHRPLRDVGLDPDPLQAVAAAYARLRPQDGESAEVVIDLLPVDDRIVARRRRQHLARARRRGPSAFGESLGTAGGGGRWGRLGQEIWAGMNGVALPRAGEGRQVRSQDVSWEVGKLTPGEQVYAVQLLIRTAARHPARAQALLQQLIAAFDPFAGENHLRPVGPRRWWRIYSNAPWRRRSFERRFTRGDFAPASRPGRRLVTAREVAGVLKPSTVRCAAPNVARCGGIIPAAPSHLPTWTGQRDVLPLGRVTAADGTERLAAVPARDILFGAGYGRSGFGKTEQALVQFIARAYSGDATWFLDPHGSAVSRALPYLTHEAVADRIWDVRLGHPSMDTEIANWNPLSMERRRPEDVQVVVGSVVGAIASAQSWGDGAPRARTILSNAVRTLAELSRLLCEQEQFDIQPTLFQLKTLLTDELWRQDVVAHLPPEVQKFWRTSFPTYTGEAITTVTNILDRLDASLSLRAFFGHPRSGYDVRRAMDDGAVVLVAPSGTGEADTLVTALLIFDLFRAGISRQELIDAGQGLRTFWAWADELTAIDGASHGNVAAILEQLRKYEVRFMGLTQMAMRLSESTRYALMNNQSLLSAASADHDEAAYLTKRLRGITPETLQGLDKYEYVTTSMVHGRRTAPFRVRGVPVHEVYADYYDPDGVPGLLRKVTATMGRRTVADVLEVQAGLDDAIVDHFSSRVSSPPPRPGGIRLVKEGISTV